MVRRLSSSWAPDENLYALSGEYRFCLAPATGRQLGFRGTPFASRSRDTKQRTAFFSLCKDSQTPERGTAIEHRGV
jgi:hypothetical protein